GAYYLLIALGLSLIFALGGIVNLAHGGFYAIGAYLAVVVAGRGRLFRAGGVAPGVGGGFRGGIRPPLFRPLFLPPPLLPPPPSRLLPRPPPWGLPVGTAGARPFVSGPPPPPFPPPPQLRGHSLIGDFFYPWSRLFILVVAVVAVTATWFTVYRTAFGRVVRA